MIESLVKKFKTHRCALDFDHGFVKAAIKEEEEHREKWLLFAIIIIIIIIMLCQQTIWKNNELFLLDSPDTQQADT